jgi:hypothetical protein
MKHVSATSTFVCIFLFFGLFIYLPRLEAQQPICQGVGVYYNSYFNELNAFYDGCDPCALEAGIDAARCHREYECDPSQYYATCSNVDWNFFYQCLEWNCEAGRISQCGPCPIPVRQPVSIQFFVVAAASPFGTIPNQGNLIAYFTKYSTTSANRFFDVRLPSPWPQVDNNNNSALYGVYAMITYNDGTVCLRDNSYTLIHG